MSNPLSELSILLHLKISKWDGEVSDQRALAAVAKAFHGNTASDKYRKSLFVDDPLKAVDKCAGRIRNNFYKWTLPWSDGGGRLVPSLDFRDFAKEHAGLVGDFDFEVNEFLVEYEDHKDRARSAKGDLYREDDYPPVDELRGRFGVSLQTLPFPSVADFRVEAPEEIITDLKENMNATVLEVTSTVADTVRSRIYERLEKLHIALDSEKRFTKSLWDELQFATDTARSLKDVIPQKMRDNVTLIEEHILSYTAEQVRLSETVKGGMVVKSGELLKRL